MIELKQISKKYTEHTTVLNNIDLTIKKGEYIAIMGPSGAGKTTLMNIIGCIDSCTGGKYILDGNDVSSYNDKEKARLRNEKFGFVVQDFGLISSMSVFQNIQIPLLYRKNKKGNQKEKIEEILKKLKLLDKINDNVNNLSGGQRQRVAIGRALVNSPDVILADKPTGALDQATGKEVMDIFTELNNEGKTVIIVTHDEQVAKCCNKIIHVVDGKVKAM
ncbi:MAG: ABC transporter ATP-binding protein [Anaerostipes sp.]|nr:ABC transporter ATP-binding protein [Anaerostipes sp.]MDD3747396.1 ABC transporter ATP-binding protein [Anaerostipes sp.]